EFAKFIDYWKAIPGSKGRKVDWDATFRNWIRRAAERKPTRGNLRSLSTVDQKVSDWLNIDVPADDDPAYIEAVILDEAKGLGQ
ncbi:MAG: hypothetical protein KDA63_12250, partial [Planctomycetales bacterium]|nr:hypothetical protein [Planctomycetales bacterium]